MALADRIRHRIAERMAAWPLTVSVGVATANLQNPAALDPTALLREADLAMYEAKKCGKNSTFAFRPDAPVAQIAASARSNGSEPTPSDRDITKKPEIAVTGYRDRSRK